MISDFMVIDNETLKTSDSSLLIVTSDENNIIVLRE